jgi:hypothetical protein
MGILSLVVPASKGVSDKEISGETLVSARELQQGMAMSEELVTDDTYYYKVLFQKYLMDKLGNYMRPASGGLSYQIEYILGGKGSDTENLKFVANRLLLIREGINLTCLYADSQKMAEVEALALLIGLGCQPAAKVIGPILMLCWSFAESILDVRELFSGGRVPLVKQSYQWQISLQNLPHLLERLDSDRKTADTGVDYEEYLHMLLLITSKEKKIMRGMDMIELTMRTSGEREGFRLDACIVAVEISMDVKANRRKTFTITRQYCYD